MDLRVLIKSVSAVGLSKARDQIALARLDLIWIVIVDGKLLGS